MWRASRLALAAARCHYEVLGVPRDAAVEDIKRAFRARAKKTHPDIAGSSDASRSFREMVEAYRVLRDPSKRKQYDQELQRAAHGFSAGGSSTDPSDPYMGSGRYWSEPGSQQAASRAAEDTATAPVSTRTEKITLGALFLGGVVLVASSDSSGPAVRDPYPSKMPTHGIAATGSRASSSLAPPEVSAALGAGGGGVSGTREARAAIAEIASQSASASSSSTVSASSSVDAGFAGLVQGKMPTATQQDAPAADELVRAFFNPFANRWMRIPDGYEAPAALDLTAWHKKRTDPVEWSRLFAEGRLSEIAPRNGLRVRYLPMWETFEPNLVLDTATNKTVVVTGNLPPRGARAAAQAAQVCEVRF